MNEIAKIKNDCLDALEKRHQDFKAELEKERAPFDAAIANGDRDAIMASLNRMLDSYNDIIATDNNDVSVATTKMKEYI